MFKSFILHELIKNKHLLKVLNLKPGTFVILEQKEIPQAPGKQLPTLSAKKDNNGNTLLYFIKNGASFTVFLTKQEILNVVKRQSIKPTEKERVTNNINAVLASVNQKAATRPLATAS